MNSFASSFSTKFIITVIELSLPGSRGLPSSRSKNAFMFMIFFPFANFYIYRLKITKMSSSDTSETKPVALIAQLWITSSLLCLGLSRLLSLLFYGQRRSRRSLRRSSRDRSRWSLSRLESRCSRLSFYLCYLLFTRSSYCLFLSFWIMALRSTSSSLILF